MDIDAGYTNGDIEAIGHIPPPGEEAEAMDQEGGDLLIFEGLGDDLARAAGLCRKDIRVRADRVEIQTAHWEEQMDNLVQAYLTYRSQDRGDRLPCIPPSEGMPEDQHVQSFMIETLDSYQCSYLFLLLPSLVRPTLMRFFTARSYPHFEPIKGEAWANETLIRHGYLGCAALQPTLAISIRTLELYHQTHRTCPRFSIEAQCKTLCFMQSVRYSTQPSESRCSLKSFIDSLSFKLADSIFHRIRCVP